MTTNPIQRDIERLGRVLPGGPPPMPAPASPNGEPRTPPELISRLPSEVSMTAQTGLEIIANLPNRLAEDLTIAANNLVRLPREVGQELLLTPGQLAQRLAPSNINKALETVRDSANFQDLDSRQRRERMRTITNVIDLFTPT